MSRSATTRGSSAQVFENLQVPEDYHSLFQQPNFNADDSLFVRSQVHYPYSNGHPQLNPRHALPYRSQATSHPMHSNSSNVVPALPEPTHIMHTNAFTAGDDISRQSSKFSGGSVTPQHVSNIRQHTQNIGLAPVEQRLSSSLSTLRLTSTPFAQGIYSLLTQCGEDYLSYTIASLYSALCIQVPPRDHTVTRAVTERPTTETPPAVYSTEILYPCQYTTDCRKSLRKVKLDIAQHLTSEHNIKQTSKNFPCTWPGCLKPEPIRGDCLAKHILRHHMPPANI
ncbi:hypothetical protein BJ138DRAFT_667572 [Hygrophoropsis aurantiaca]|uniref:Uncharacterized protein n=1 Tax=Hygrophoropsis aurantiaca TaxID=72124 RepID=A0ACB8AJN9_9AGAM|nr:hypothetical protein BJ138DRAFT_667572 [Hygrophoropsis aurantiaca]